MTDKWKVEKVGPSGLIASAWFDENGNYHTLYENGSESVISAEVIRDDMEGRTMSPSPSRDATVCDAAELVVEAFFDIGPNCRAFENCIADLRAALRGETQGGTCGA